MSPEMVLEIYGGQHWRDFIANKWIGAVFQGEDLVDALLKTDNVYAARRVLKAAQDLGLIKRLVYRPTEQQLFFGSNSQFGNACNNPLKTDHDLIMYEFEIAAF